MPSPGTAARRAGAALLCQGHGHVTRKPHWEKDREGTTSKLPTLCAQNIIRLFHLFLKFPSKGFFHFQTGSGIQSLSRKAALLGKVTLHARREGLPRAGAAGGDLLQAGALFNSPFWTPHTISCSGLPPPVDCPHFGRTHAHKTTGTHCFSSQKQYVYPQKTSENTGKAREVRGEGDHTLSSSTSLLFTVRLTLAEQLPPTVSTPKLGPANVFGHETKGKQG